MKIKSLFVLAFLSLTTITQVQSIPSSFQELFRADAKKNNFLNNVRMLTKKKSGKWIPCKKKKKSPWFICFRNIHFKSSFEKKRYQALLKKEKSQSNEPVKVPHLGILTLVYQNLEQNLDYYIGRKKGANHLYVSVPEESFKEFDRFKKKRRYKLERSTLRDFLHAELMKLPELEMLRPILLNTKNEFKINISVNSSKRGVCIFSLDRKRKYYKASQNSLNQYFLDIQKETKSFGLYDSTERYDIAKNSEHVWRIQKKSDFENAKLSVEFTNLTEFDTYLQIRPEDQLHNSEEKMPSLSVFSHQEENNVISEENVNQIFQRLREDKRIIFKIRSKRKNKKFLEIARILSDKKAQDYEFKKAGEDCAILVLRHKRSEQIISQGVNLKVLHNNNIGWTYYSLKKNPCLFYVKVPSTTAKICQEYLKKGLCFSVLSCKKLIFEDIQGSLHHKEALSRLFGLEERSRFNNLKNFFKYFERYKSVLRVGLKDKTLCKEILKGKTLKGASYSYTCAKLTHGTEYVEIRGIENLRSLLFNNVEAGSVSEDVPDQRSRSIFEKLPNVNKKDSQKLMRPLKKNTEQSHRVLRSSVAKSCIKEEAFDQENGNNRQSIFEKLPLFREIVEENPISILNKDTIRQEWYTIRKERRKLCIEINEQNIESF